MTDTKQPEALRLADQYRDHGGADMSHFDHIEWASQAEYCLRVQHARIAALEAENSALKGELEAIDAGGVTGLRDSVPCWPQLYQAWQRVGADTALLDWREFVRVACQNPYAAIAQEGGK